MVYTGCDRRKRMRAYIAVLALIAASLGAQVKAVIPSGNEDRFEFVTPIEYHTYKQSK